LDSLGGGGNLAWIGQLFTSYIRKLKWIGLGQTLAETYKLIGLLGQGIGGSWWNLNPRKGGYNLLLIKVGLEKLFLTFNGGYSKEFTPGRQNWPNWASGLDWILDRWIIQLATGLGKRRWTNFG